MARLQNAGDSVFRIREFLGLNENPDGDTHLRPGELAEMRNFRITQDRHLQIRPGQRTLLRLRESWDEWAKTESGAVKDPRFCGAWTGLVAGERQTLAAFGGCIFQLDLEKKTAKAVGKCTQDETCFFGFGDKVYLLNGHEYLSWDGKAESKFTTVEGYIPTVLTAAEPGGRGTALEKANRLTGKRRAKFSPDGQSTSFQLPDKAVDEVISVKGWSASYSLDKANGRLNFSSAPSRGTNTLEIVYRKGQGKREEVTAMRCAELFNGLTDTRVFLYGDGSSKTIYSGVDLDKSRPTADYFPDLHEAIVGGANAPITAMVRHFGRLMVFTSESCWSMDANWMTDPAGAKSTAFRVSPVNRGLGNLALGQVRLLENDPLSLDGGGVYQWQAAAGSNGDNREARRISDRVSRTLRSFSLRETRTFDRKGEQEFWFLCGDQALIYNYANNSWYLYGQMPFLTMLEIEGRVFGFTREGRMVELSRRWREDDGAPIDAYAETGSLDFGKDFSRKCSPVLYVALQPESGGRISVTAETNRKSDYPVRIVTAGLSNFTHVDFRHFSFGTNRKPQVRRVKLRVSKATFYKLVFRSKSASAAATVLETDIRLRYTGNVR